NKWVAFIHLHKVYIAPLPHTGQTLDLDVQTKSFPVSQLSRDAGVNLHWSADSKKVFWTLGEEYYSSEIEKRFTYLPNSPDSIAPPDSSGIKINLVIPTDKPTGSIA